MKRFLKIAVPVFLLGFGAGMAFWYLASPLWIDRVVDEVLVQSDASEVLATGSFAGVDGVHQAKGDVTLLRQADGTVQLQFAGFEVTNGPDLKVWMIAHPDPQGAGDIKESEQLRLSQLKGNIGDQVYTLPADTDVNAFKSVVIYCQQFSFMFASAPLS
ncbi:MAG: DM13 domain-containing protein [Paracoccaceae bacterium]